MPCNEGMPSVRNFWGGSCPTGIKHLVGKGILGDQMDVGQHGPSTMQEACLHGSLSHGLLPLPQRHIEELVVVFCESQLRPQSFHRLDGVHPRRQNEEHRSCGCGVLVRDFQRHSLWGGNGGSPKMHIASKKAIRPTNQMSDPFPEKIQRKAQQPLGSKNDSPRETTLTLRHGCRQCHPEQHVIRFAPG